MKTDDLTTLNRSDSDSGTPTTDDRSLITDDGLLITKLASLSPLDYDRTRKQAARSLRVRVETIDAEVTRVRNQIREDEAFNSALSTLHSPLPWPDPVNGAELLIQILERFRHYLFLPLGAAEAFTLWSAHAHCFSAFIQSPRLNISSPEPGCGKTTALDVIATLTPRPLRTENLTAPVLFRLVHQYQPTLLLDEVDAWLPQAEELRGLLNAGHKRGACAYRCEGEGNAVRPFRAFGPAALAGIGQLTGTLHDRSIVVPLLKASAEQTPHRFDDHRIEIEIELCRKLARWTADNFAALKACEPPLPPTAFNRLADNWRPLFAIAQIAGAPWPELALSSFNHLVNPPLPLSLALAPPSPVGTLSTASPNSALSTQNSELLADIRQIFAQSGASRLSSAQLVQALCALPGRNYHQRPQKLTRHIACSGIRSRNLRMSGRVIKGYESTDFL